MGVRERTSRGAPCIFCGDVGYDMRITYTDNGEQTTIHWCHKTHATKNDVVSVNGKSYICKAAAKEIEIGEFDLWEEYLSKDEWIEKQKRINPDWKPGKFAHGGMQGRRVELNVSSKPQNAGPIPGEEPVLPREKLHEIYSYMLSLLIIEDKHKAQLLDEWGSSLHPSLFDSVTGSYPIKSLPPIDKARFANKESYKNPTRKAIVSRLLAKFGDLRGVPGFYLRSGSYYQDKPESERWTLAPNEGLLFPCPDKDGYIQLRLREEYPDIKLKEGKDKPFHGKYGIFHHHYDKDGKHTWTFYPDNGEPEVVYSEQVKSVSLNQKGCPDVGGKVNGKYKAFSSVSGGVVNGVVVNALEGGSRNGSAYGLYHLPNASFAVVIGTEGEKKAMISSIIRKCPTVSVPGVDNYSCLFKKDASGMSCIDYLKAKGMKYFVLCYDADKTEKPSVQKAETRFIEELKKHGVVPCIGDWKGKFNKGLDDILVMGLDIHISPA